MNAPEHHALLTLGEAARRSGHAPVSLKQAIWRGSLTATKVGTGNRATYLVTEADLRAYLAARKSWRSYGNVTRKDLAHGKAD